MTDERFNAPSASAMRRISNCPPSHKLGAQFKEESSAEASHGDKVHLALELDDSAGLVADELATWEMCRDQRFDLLDEWNGDDYAYEVHKERRLGMTALGIVKDVDGSNLKFVFSGKADYVAVTPTKAIIIDYKTLHGEHDHAAKNDQLRSLAVLVSRRFKVDQVRVAIVQPWKGKPTVADFGAADLVAAGEWLMDALKREKESTPDQAKPGDWCKYCKARVKCEAFNSNTLTTATTELMQVSSFSDETARKAMFARAAELPDNELAARYRALKPIGWYVSAVEGNVRMRAAENGSFAAEYFRAVEGKPRDNITDVEAVWRNLSDMGVDPALFAASCKITKKAIEALVRGATGFKGKELRAAIERATAGAITQGKPPVKIVAVGEQLEEGDDDEM